MTNPKIEKVKAAIAKTKATIADYQNRLKEQERQKIQLENDEIVAMFRRENLNEDEFKAILRSGGSGKKQSGGQAGSTEERNDGPALEDGLPVAGAMPDPTDGMEARKEDIPE